MLQRCFVKVLLIVVIGSISQGAFGSDWLGFRGPDGQGVSKATDLPVTWDDSKNLLWKKAMPGYGSSSPISLGDKLFGTCYSGHGTDKSSGNIKDLRLHALCINAKNGDIIWDKKFKPSQPESKKVRDHGYAAPTPATDGKHLYYTIKQGDNLWDIANKYEGVSVEQLKRLNKEVKFKSLKLGTKIKIKSVG